MRYFLDTEYNGFGGQLISIALVPEFGDQEFYATFALPEKVHPWVQDHVLPYLLTVPPGMHEQMTVLDAAEEIARFLAHDQRPVVVADWPEDIGHFCSLLTTGPGDIAAVGSIESLMLRTRGFSSAANSRVPHNALHDARALRDFVLESDSFVGVRA